MDLATEHQNVNYPDFLQTYRTRLSELYDRYDHEKLKDDRSATREFVKELREAQPLAVLLPDEYGGKGPSTADFLSMLEITAYESLPFSLLFGINGALFMQPLLKYGSDSIKDEILGSFIEDKLLGGLMISEPEHGTDALHMQSSFTQSNGTYEISGTKHWGGLTGMAQHWIVAARREQEDGTLGRDISLFVCDQTDIEVEEYYHNLGLAELPYGRNRIETEVGDHRKLNSDVSGIRLMQDLLHRSRLEFPGMAAGYLRRIRDEAYERAHNRKVSGATLNQYENVKRYLNFFDTAVTISAAMCRYTADNVGLEDDVSGETILSNAIKAYVTDLMQQAADTFLQLSGANGYRRDHLSGQSYVDTRSFQIFEGPNDVLYSQIGEKVLNVMSKNSLTSLDEFIDHRDDLSHVPEDIDADLSESIDFDMVQNQQVVLGELVTRIVSLNLVATLKNRGFSTEQYHRCKPVLEEAIRTRFFELTNRTETSLPQNRMHGHEWRSFLK